MEGEPKHLVCEKCWSSFFSTSEFQELCQRKSSTNPNEPRINERDVITLGRVRKKDGIPSYDIDVGTVKSGVLSGCAWCGLIADLSVHFDNKEKGSRGGFPMMKVSDATESDRLYVELRQAFGTQCVPDGNNCFELEVNWTCFEFYLFTTDESGSPNLTVTARPVRTRVEDGIAIDQIKTWLHDCDSHDTCLATAPTQLPSRVIEVMPPDCSPQARLCITGKKVAEYIALSYCWGPSQRGVTTKANIEERLRDLDLSALSQTVRDAIHMTRTLGYQYLWVDAICIVQDSDEDQVHELQSMSQVYQNSSLTIIAANTPSSEQGFLSPRQAPHAIKIPFWTTDGETASVLMSRWNRAKTGEEHEVINKRAWTLQERLLSRRRLIFNSDALQYACMRGTATNGDSILVLTPSSFFTRYRLPFRHQVQLSAQGTLEAWTSIVNFYSKRNLAKQEDRLTAIAAMASLFSANINEVYLAGLWAGPHLLSSLMWYQLEGEIECEWSTTKYIAPSWSWASRRKPVEYDCHTWHYDLSSFQLEVKRTETVLQYPSLPFGPVTAASLHVCGLIRKATYVAPNAILWDNHGQSNNSSSASDTSQVASNDKGKDVSEAWAWFDEKVATDHRMRVWCLAVRTPSIWAAKGDREHEEKDFLDGLMLVKTEQPNTYRRVGLLLDGRVDEFANCERSDIILV